MAKKTSQLDKLIALLEKMKQSKKGEKKAWQIIAKWYQESKIPQAKVITAVKLNQKQLAIIEDRLISIFKKPIKAVNKVDKNILGGLKIIVGSKIIDASIEGQLKKILKN